MPTLVVPAAGNREFLLNPLVFQGPCNSYRLHFQVGGRIVAPDETDEAAWRNNRQTWIAFFNVDGLSLNGGGSFDGRGQLWWDLCKNEDFNCTRPTALYFNNCNRLRLSKLRHLNSAKNHIGISASNIVRISRLAIAAPGDSPNTDGIDISGSSYVRVRDTVIGTGDDCIAINGFCSHVDVARVACGPGHGISVGSLGEDGAYQTVSDVRVADCVFNRTLSGARIKTWQGGSGYVKNVTFERLRMIDAGNPIIINQDYVNNRTGSPPSNIQISDVTYDGVSGTSSVPRAIYFHCEEGTSGNGCDGIVLKDVHIAAAAAGVETYAVCVNAHGTSTPSNFPSVSCLAP
ncbi:unnamed protein product [Linum tenue]|nr:unnamed protein product [Linum tenue]